MLRSSPTFPEAPGFREGHDIILTELAATIDCVCCAVTHSNPQPAQYPTFWDVIQVGERDMTPITPEAMTYETKSCATY
jgi:hypothetical protein